MDSKRKLVGIGMVLVFFVGLFAIFAVDHGIVATILVLVLVVSIVAWLITGILWSFGESWALLYHDLWYIIGKED